MTEAAVEAIVIGVVLAAWGLAVMVITRLIDGRAWRQAVKQAFKNGYTEGWNRREAALARTALPAVQGPSSAASARPADIMAETVAADLAPASTDGEAAAT